MLGVFLLPALTRLGHERQDLLSLCHGMYVCTDYTSDDTLIRKSFGGMESEPMLTPRGKSSRLEKFSPEENRDSRRCIRQDSKPNTLPTSYSDPCVRYSNNENHDTERCNSRCLQSPHCIVNCPQHIHSSCQGAVMCKSCATIPHLLHPTCVPCGMQKQLTY